jgi:dienelactone hydrolase
LLAISSRGAVAKEEITLPAPSGPYQVGTISYHWIDQTREEQWTVDTHDFRELVVQLWYPATNQVGAREAPYIPDLDRLRSSIDQYWPDRAIIHTHATIGPPLEPTNKQYPVIIFSHGMNSARFRYTAIACELASHGYIVAAIEHTYWGPGVAFPNGKTVRLEDGMIARDKLSSDQIDRMMQQGITVMAADQNFVFQKLVNLNAGRQKSKNPFRHRLDLQRVGAIGHSMGGMAATRACLEYTAIKACISLDGPDYFLNLRPASSAKPFLLLLNSDWGRGAPGQIKGSYLAAWRNPIVAIINGAKHNSFSDIPLTKKDALTTKEIAPARALNIISAFSVAFFDKFLRGWPSELPGGSERFPEVEMVDLRSITDTSPKN